MTEGNIITGDDFDENYYNCCYGEKIMSEIPSFLSFFKTVECWVKHFFKNGFFLTSQAMVFQASNDHVNLISVATAIWKKTRA